MITRKPTSKAQTPEPLSALSAERPPFKLRPVSFEGSGLQPEFEGTDFRRLRDAAGRDPALAKS